jgi:serine/threonine protein kinase
VADEGQITLDGSLLGSPAYMSPQQAVDDHLDGRSDLFSLGTVLFHAVTGHIPFAGSNASIILRNIIDGQRAEVLELNPEAAPALASVIDRLLQTRAEDRYADADAAAAALQAAFDESEVPPGHPLINVRSWLVNPREVNDALRAHLQTTLLARGKTRLAEGDRWGTPALQSFAGARRGPGGGP